MSRTLVPSRAIMLLLAAVLMSGTALAAPSQVVFTGQTQPADWTWYRTDAGYHAELIGGRTLDQTDRPDLPARDIMLLIPADLPLADLVVEPLATHVEEAPGALAVAAPLQASDGGTRAVDIVPASDAAFPAVWGEYRGLRTWHGYRLAAVTVYPLRAVAPTADGTPQVEVLDAFRIRQVTDPAITVEPPLARQRLVPGERQRLESALQKLVVNPEVLGGYARQDGVKVSADGEAFLPTPNPSLEGSPVRYLVITNQAMALEFNRLVQFRTAQGFPGLVVTRSWIESHGRHGVDFQETLRLFLQDAYAKWGMEYVLLGGDTDILPPRWVRSNFYPFGGHTDVPTDLYFSCLDGNWNADGDSWMGQPYYSTVQPGDEADFMAEVGIGRAPVSTVDAAQAFVDKVIAYESAAASTNWPNRFLFAAEVLFPADWHPGDSISLDGATYAEEIIDNQLTPCTTMAPTRMYENNTAYSGAAHLTRAALIDTLNTGHYGMFNQIGHGYYFNMSVGDANFRTGDADMLTNPNYFVLYALNCASGAFDFSCLMERFLQNPHGGSIASIGSSREAFPATSDNYQQQFYTGLLCNGVDRAADAVTYSRLPYVDNTDRNTVDRWTQLNYNLLGDPALAIWTGQPRAITVSAASSIPTGPRTLTVTVTASGSPVAGALVCAAKDAETYAYGLTNASGQAALSVNAHSAGQLVVTATGLDLARTTRNVTITVPSTYVTCTDELLHDQSGSGAVVGNGNNQAEAGETVELTLVAHDQGGAGATNVQAHVTTSTPGATVLVGTVAFANIAANGYGVSQQNVVLNLASSMTDGAFVDLTVTITVNGTGNFVSQLKLPVMAPEVEPVALTWSDSAPYGNGNGILENNERVAVSVNLKNYGAGRYDSGTGRLRTSSANITLVDTLTTYSGLNLLDSQAGAQTLSLRVINAANAASSPCWLLVVDNYGRTVRHDFTLAPPSTPEVPTTDTTLGPNTIALRWAPVNDADVRGYNVYRSTSESGTYARVNPDLLDGVSFYEDDGLDQLTVYYYKVTAVDSSLVESAASPVISQPTTPPEMEAFPQPFAVETSSHPAVGDVNGDGTLEIVLASDEVYVWQANGQELIDGDHDAQTNGPITGIDGQFEPAGVALANLDGQPGLEIVVSERLVGKKIYIYRADGSIMPGWPQTMNDWNWATPAIGDVDGDGEPEIVVNNVAGRTYVWHVDGTELRDGDNDPATNGVFAVRPDETWNYSSPTLVDLDGDGKLEIVMGTLYYNSNNGLLAYRFDGSMMPGFPIATGTNRVICSPAAADLDGDGSPEIVFFDVSHRLFVVRSNGVAYPGFPITRSGIPWDESAGPSPALGDLDGDGHPEILWPINGGGQRLDLVAVDTGIDDGTSGHIMSGWPVTLPGNTEGSPVIGDIDGDMSLDILVGIGGGATEAPENLYALHADGTSITGFPIHLDGPLRTAPVICDLNGDGDVDIVYGAWDRYIHVWDMPFAYNAGRVPWPTFHGNMARTGVLADLTGVPVPDADLPASFVVQPPYPNPFNPQSSVRLYVPGAAGATAQLDVSVYDLAGRRVRQLQHGEVPTGWQTYTWDGHDGSGRALASGVYVLRATHAGQATNFKISLVK